MAIKDEQPTNGTQYSVLSTQYSLGRVIGLDIGTHRIGVAVSDELQLIASPETTVLVAQNAGGQGAAIAELVALVHRFAARRIVAGLPRNMKGERGVQAEWTEAFVASLQTALREDHVRFAFFDERLTSVEATRSLREDSGGVRRNKRDAKDGRQTVDARAAALILQGYLDLRSARRRIERDKIE